MKWQKIDSSKLREANRLTYSQLLSENRPLAQGWAVPAAVAELILTLVDAQLGAFADDDDGIGASLTEGSLTRGQSRDLVADDVCTESNHRGECPGDGEGAGVMRGRFWTETNMYIRLNDLQD